MEKEKTSYDLQSIKTNMMAWFSHLHSGQEKEGILYYKNESSCEKCYHYTSFSSLLKIFDCYINRYKSSDNNKELAGSVNDEVTCEMLATNIKFLNDPSEQQEGINFLKEKNDGGKVEGLINSFAQVHAISFCGEGDLLTQWKYYGKNSGVAIGFNIKNIKQFFTVNNDELASIEYLFADVAYTNTDRDKLWDKRNDLQPFASIYPVIFTILCKNINFEEEKEKRFVYFPLGKTQEYNFSYLISENYTPKPVLRVKMKPKDENSPIINSLVVGPGQNQNLVFNALIHIFDTENFKFHEENEVANLAEGQELENGKVFLVKNEKEMNRKAYKCKNGIIIYKSAIPFRG